MTTVFSGMAIRDAGAGSRAPARALRTGGLW